MSSIFYKQLLRQYSFAKKLQSQNVSREKLRKALLYKKGARKMLMKLTPECKNLSSRGFIVSSGSLVPIIALIASISPT